MSGLLGVSITGLRVSQTALRTAGHNIANANTEGYSRQSTDINSLGGNQTGAGFIGNGAYVSQIQRVVDQFIINQMRSDTSMYNEMNSYNQYIAQLNDTLSNPSTGLTQAMETFFASLQNMTDDPSSLSARELFSSETETLEKRFNTLHSRIDGINVNVDENITSTVENINALAQSIATLNQSITEVVGTSDQNQPNDLLDQRDEALRELAQFVNVNTTVQGAAINVSIGTDVPLVVGETLYQLEIGQNEFDPQRTEIFVPALVQPVTESLIGGELGGLVEIQRSIIEPTLNQLGQVALAIAESFNEAQQQGITLSNLYGNDVFLDINDRTVINSRVLPSTNNTTSDHDINVTIEDVSELTTSDYKFILDNTASAYRIVRLEDNQEILSGAFAGVLPTNIEFDGLSLNLNAGTYSANDEFLIRPTRNGATDFHSLSIPANEIALASPVLTGTGVGNTGSGEISLGEVLSLTDANDNPLPLLATLGEMSPPLLVSFTTETTYDILDNSDPANPVQLSPPIRNQIYISGIENSLFGTDLGATTVVSGGTALGLPVGSTAVASGLAVNGYPSETFTFTTTDPDTGATTTQNVTSIANASARNTASALDNVDGVTASAFNYLELRDFSLTLTAPLQITLNNENLIPYDGANIRIDVPSPSLNSGEDFNDYVAEQINSNDALAQLGIYAVSSYDATANEFYIAVHSTRGDDLTVQLEAQAGDVIEVNDGTNADVSITGAGAGTVNEVLVGGQIDVTLADTITMTSAPSPSVIFGAISAASNYLGIQANIRGRVEAGDRFTLDFNNDAALDNRNGLTMVDLQLTATIDSGQKTFNDAYSDIVESIGIKTNVSKINLDAAENVLEQTTSLRDSISGVNLDEEATDLIRFEQLYSANAQVINVSRDLFDRLINSF